MSFISNLISNYFLKVQLIWGSCVVIISVHSSIYIYMHKVCTRNASLIVLNLLHPIYRSSHACIDLLSRSISRPGWGETWGVQLVQQHIHKVTCSETLKLSQYIAKYLLWLNTLSFTRGQVHGLLHIQSHAANHACNERGSHALVCATLQSLWTQAKVSGHVIMVPV